MLKWFLYIIHRSHGKYELIFLLLENYLHLSFILESMSLIKGVSYN